MAFGVIDFFQVSIVGYRFDALLGRDNFIIAGHHNHHTEFQPFGQVHVADGDVAAGCFDSFIKHLEWQPCFADCSTSAIQFRVRADEYADLVCAYSLIAPNPQPLADSVDFFCLAVECLDDRSGAVEHP